LIKIILCFQAIKTKLKNYLLVSDFDLVSSGREEPCNCVRLLAQGHHQHSREEPELHIQELVFGVRSQLQVHLNQHIAIDQFHAAIAHRDLLFE
jgi:hypothetical protein